VDGREYVDRGVVEAIGREHDKQRFAPVGDRTRDQVHSCEVEFGLAPRTPPPALFQGTAVRTLPRIFDGGLRPMARQHAHLSADLETARRVGTRHGRPMVPRVDCGAMRSAGFEFLLAENGVRLANRVPAEFPSRRP
jgi:putative RNA 2'-phosphotransferase